MTIKYTQQDKAWSKAVRDRDDWRCVVCGSEIRPNAHHIIPRQILTHKHDVMNGITLCPKHHRFSFDLSPHQNPLAFFRWMLKHRRETLKYLIKLTEVYK